MGSVGGRRQVLMVVPGMGGAALAILIIIMVLTVS